MLDEGPLKFIIFVDLLSRWWRELLDIEERTLQ